MSLKIAKPVELKVLVPGSCNTRESTYWLFGVSNHLNIAKPGQWLECVKEIMPSDG